MKKNIIIAMKGVLLDKGKILIVKRSEKDDIGAGSWECPGGKLEFGETPEQALKREILEETGLTVQVEELLYVSTFFTSPVRQVIIITYLCTPETDTISLSEEHSESMWAGKTELLKYLNPDILKDFEKYNLLALEGLE